jgi:hypothetical protein
MSKHTPGPWIGAGPSFGDPLPRYTTSIVTEWGHEDEGCIDICELPFHHYDDENEANARLIAAAPALLEALEGFVEHGTCSDDEDMAKARAAIKAAKGEA